MKVRVTFKIDNELKEALVHYYNHNYGYEKTKVTREDIESFIEIAISNRFNDILNDHEEFKKE